MALLCVRGDEPQASSEKIFRGRVWHHHELEISFGRQEHTVISLLFTFFANLSTKIVKSIGEIIIVLYNNDHCCTYSTIMNSPFHLTSFFKENYCTISFLVNLQTLNNNAEYCIWPLSKQNNPIAKNSKILCIVAQIIAQFGLKR